mmetsp:Transcript_43090/g.108303  ORF Transcript_43090/g.108303 Transcript_43090/m.108303 type:complete len:220 (-) Transcript_43090:192-851(-)
MLSRRAGRSSSSVARSAKQRTERQSKWGDSSSKSATSVRPASLLRIRVGTCAGYSALGFGAAPSSARASKASKRRFRANEPQIPDGQPLPFKLLITERIECQRLRRLRYSCQEPLFVPQSASHNLLHLGFSRANLAHSRPAQVARPRLRKSRSHKIRSTTSAIKLPTVVISRFGPSTVLVSPSSKALSFAAAFTVNARNLSCISTSSARLRWKAPRSAT